MHGRPERARVIFRPEELFAFSHLAQGASGLKRCRAENKATYPAAAETKPQMDGHFPAEAPIEDDDILSEILGESIPPEPAPNAHTEISDPKPIEVRGGANQSLDVPPLDANPKTPPPPNNETVHVPSDSVSLGPNGEDIRENNEAALSGPPGKNQARAVLPSTQVRNDTPPGAKLPRQREMSSSAVLAAPAPKNEVLSIPAARATPPSGQTVQDKIKGALFGAALGDALGLQTDGLQSAEIVERYPRGLKFPASVRFQGNQASDWSGLSDQMILAMRTLREWHDRLTGEPEHALAQKLAHWAKYGMTDLGDSAGPATDRLTREVTKDPNFLLQPRAVAKRIQEQRPVALGSPEGGSFSNPGALLRAIPAAFAAENSLRWAELLTQVTHAAPKDALAARCTVRFVWAAASLEERPLAADTLVSQLGRLLEEAQKLGLKDFEETALPLFIHSRELDFLASAPPNAPGVRIGADLGGATVYRVLACGLWVLRAFIRGEPRTPEFVKERLARCAMMGGAACANTSLVGALLGAAVGFSGLPADWLKALPFHDALASETDLFLKAIGLPTKTGREQTARNPDSTQQ